MLVTPILLPVAVTLIHGICGWHVLHEVFTMVLRPVPVLLLVLRLVPALATTTTVVPPSTLGMGVFVFTMLRRRLDGSVLSVFVVAVLCRPNDSILCVFPHTRIGIQHCCLISGAMRPTLVLVPAFALVMDTGTARPWNVTTTGRALAYNFHPTSISISI